MPAPLANEQLREEAIELCSWLSKAYWRELDNRDKHGNFAGDADYVAQLNYLWCKAAARWQRRAGYKPLEEARDRR